VAIFKQRAAAPAAANNIATSPSYGLTTLNSQHIKTAGAELRFRFAGKGGRIWRVKLKSRHVAKVVRACQELPGQGLFQYEDAEG
jgi:DNA topoisomerase-1